MPKTRTVLITIEAQTPMSLVDLKSHVRDALTEYFSEESEFSVQQVSAQVTQAPAAPKAGLRAKSEADLV